MPPISYHTHNPRHIQLNLAGTILESYKVSPVSISSKPRKLQGIFWRTPLVHGYKRVSMIPNGGTKRAPQGPNILFLELTAY